jgi:HSP20 family protein
MATALRRRDPRPQLTRWEPFSELEELQNRMGQLMQNVITGEGDGRVWIPSVDIEETDDEWVVEAELPGVKRNDVNVEVRESELVINGEIKERERKGILRRQTRRVGRFDYRVTLPGQPDADNVKASLDDGVLTVRVAKAAEAKPKRIEIAETKS